MAQEKDRRTFVLLLLTNLSDRELVLGKLLASLLHVLVMFAAGLPVFMLLWLLGGISVGQIAARRRSPRPASWSAAASARRWRCGGRRPFRPWPCSC